MVGFQPDREIMKPLIGGVLQFYIHEGYNTNETVTKNWGDKMITRRIYNKEMKIILRRWVLISKKIIYKQKEDNHNNYRE